MNHLILQSTAYPLGTAALSMPAYTHLNSTIQFTVNTAIADGDGAQFEVRCADHSPTDRCAPGPFTALEEVMICGRPAEPAGNTIIALRGPLAAGQICKAAVPCPCAFLQVIPAATPNPDFPSGEEGSVDVIGLLEKPK